MKFWAKAIGVIHSPFKVPEEAPQQGAWSEAISEIEVFEEFAAGLEGLQGASHILVLYWCHRSSREMLHAKPPHEERPKGVFATRSPHRPNPIALCVAKVLEMKGRTLKVKGLDALDGSPLIDLKPYYRELDALPDDPEST